MPLSHLDDWRVGENEAGEDVMYYPDLLDLIDKFENISLAAPTKDQYKHHLDFLAVAVMVWDYPSRADKYNIRIINKQEDAKEKEWF